VFCLGFLHLNATLSARVTGNKLAASQQHYVHDIECRFHGQGIKKRLSQTQKPLSGYLLTKISRAIPVSMANSENPTLKM